jgi:hypothetical protein
MTLHKTAALSLILVLSFAVPGFSQNLKGWVPAPSSKDNAGLWTCAGYGGSWEVSEHQGRIAVTDYDPEKQAEAALPAQVKLSKEMIGTRTVLRTMDGWLVGFDGGEFGGGLWWFSRNGQDIKKLPTNNVHAISKTPDGIFVLEGIAHLSLDTGAIDRFIETPDEISLQFVANLKGSPEASTVRSDGQIVVATMHSVLLVDHFGHVNEIYKSGEDLVYPTSVVVDGQGNIFVAMRFFVLQLVPNNGRYDPQWLMPGKCRSVKQVNYRCVCTAKD